MNAPEPCGKDVDICMFVDSDHAREKSILQVKTWFLDICKNSISAIVLKETVYSRDFRFWC